MACVTFQPEFLLLGTFSYISRINSLQLHQPFAIAWTNAFQFSYVPSQGECKTWTVDYGLIHALGHGLFPHKKIALLMLALRPV